MERDCQELKCPHIIGWETKSMVHRYAKTSSYINFGINSGYLYKYP